MPRFTAAERRLILTLEGWIVVAFNLAMVIIPIVSSSLPAASAAKFAAIVDTGTVLARQLAKGIAAWQAPLMIPPPPVQVTPLVEPPVGPPAPMVTPPAA
jgi:hypothetical protein